MVENTFRILYANWHIYRRPILGNNKLVKAIVKATVCLHNSLLIEEENLTLSERKYVSSMTPDTIDAEGSTLPGQWRNDVTGEDALRNLGPTQRLGSNRYSLNATHIREMYTDFFLGEGQIEQQW
ncbi:hypothetical protein PR048_011745 [Dryococelus australis]|uniref:DDE Tnp4 domain-containing protein n=1 Tax=Dryococelus australis TaxID=614101 RepID=A0ABQ9HMS4_9NEOP|nr:hypothetical protein PR048_011745 [Dryococelus australis]